MVFGLLNWSFETDIIIIIITEICIAPFPEVNQIKGALQKIEKQFAQTAR